MEKDKIVKNIERLAQISGISLSRLADKAGLTPSTVTRFVNDYRGHTISMASLDKLAIASGYPSYQDFLFQDRDKNSPKKEVKLMGYIGENAILHELNEDSDWDGVEVVECPPGVDSDKIKAIRIKGNALYPLYDDGDILYYDADAKSRLDSSCINKLCLVQVKDGQTYVKTLTKGTQHFNFTLTSFNTPPIDDVQIEWAAKILWVKK